MNNKASLIDDEDYIYLIPIAVIVIIFAIYKFKFEWLVMAWKTLRIGELYILQWIPEFIQEGTGLKFSKTLEFLKTTPSRHIHRETVSWIDSNLFWFIKYSVAFILITFGVKIYRWDSGQKGYITPEGYLKEMGPLFDSTKPYIDINPSEHSIYYDFEKTPEENCFAMPLDIDDFVTCNPPLLIRKNETQRSIAQGVDWSDYDMSLARTCFERQLGRKMKGLKHLKPYEREIFKRCAKQIPNKYRTEIINALQKRHAYVRTFLLGLLENARRYGVIPAHVFRFELKRNDRLLYLALASLGVKMSKRPYVEVAGIMAHYQFEQRLGHSVSEPMVESCVTELQDVLKDMSSGVSKNKRDKSYNEVQENLV